jgi:hypothetical protein
MALSETPGPSPKVSMSIPRTRVRPILRLVLMAETSSDLGNQKTLPIKK